MVRSIPWERDQTIREGRRKAVVFVACSGKTEAGTLLSRLTCYLYFYIACGIDIIHPGMWSIAFSSGRKEG